MSHARSTTENHQSSRRQFLRNCFDTCGGLAATLLFTTVAARQSFAQSVFGDVVGSRPYGRIEKVSDGIWALVSTPFNAEGGAGDRTTLSNGGIIVGTDGILAIDSYRMPQGAEYMANACRFLTGRLPTHVVHTHYHFDHIGGTRGFFKAGASPDVIMTQPMRELVFKAYGKAADKKDKESTFAKTGIGTWGGTLTDATHVMPDESTPVVLDLGGRSVTITPMRGHTGSDLVVRDDKTQTIFGGDMIWDGIFPNYMSAHPADWRKSVQALLSNRDSIIVPGHGGVAKATAQEMQKFGILLSEVEDHARRSHEKGLSVDAAAKALNLSEKLAGIKYFRPGFHAIAMDTWYKALKG